MIVHSALISTPFSLLWLQEVSNETSGSVRILTFSKHEALKQEGGLGRFSKEHMTPPIKDRILSTSTGIETKGRELNNTIFA